MTAEDFDLEDLTTPIDPTNELDTETGFDIGGIVGYDFGLLRLEGEVGYRRASNDELSTPGLTIGDDDLGGHASALSFMVNGLLDIGPDDGVQLFAGGGAGIARVEHTINNSAGVMLMSDDATEFAWQLLGGARVPISDKFDLGVKYRYFKVPNYEIAGNDGLVETDWASHSLLATLAMNFGGSEPPPPPPPPAPPPPPPPPAPPPPPPPPAPTCNSGPYIVFFDWDRSDITPEAAAILDNAVTAYGSCDNVPIMLAGYADRSGSASYNVGLSQRRADAVEACLTGKGIPQAAISSEAFGETNPRVPTADGVRELQNRRVEITYGPGSGM